MSDQNPSVPPVDNSHATPDSIQQEAAARRPILIGSQRDPEAFRPKRNDWTPVAPSENPASEAAPAAELPTAPPVVESPVAAAPAAEAPAVTPAAAIDVPTPVAPQTAAQPRGERGSRPSQGSRPPRGRRDDGEASAEKKPGDVEFEREPIRPQQRIPVPSVRDRLSPDMENELDAALSGASLDDLLIGNKRAAQSMKQLELESKTQGRVVAVRRDEVFLDLGSREQGCLPARQFDGKLPEVGAVLEVIVQKFNEEDGIYELSLPHSARHVEDWGDLTTDMIVEAKVTGHNAGGLECEVNHIRGFIPISQIALYRVEDLAQFVGESFTCLVTEANPERRNLVLSRRALLEREKEETKKKFLEAIAPGQVYEGTVRKIMDFGAFVDIGGADGLLHISQLAWHRVQHPSEILSEGQHIKVRVEKYDAATGKIGLSYRELFESPWTGVADKYPIRGAVRGKVTRLMDFGAFVELEPGVEGLVHISELSHKRLYRASDAVKEGDEVEVMVLAVDPDAQRISLSLKAMSNAPEAAKKEPTLADDKPDPALPAPTKAVRAGAKTNQPLKGGIGRGSGGEQFGLRW